MRSYFEIPRKPLIEAFANEIKPYSLHELFVMFLQWLEHD